MRSHLHSFLARRALGSLASLLALAASARADVPADATVPGTFATIQAAVTGATDVNNDGIVCVTVGAGTFTTRVDITRSNFELRGAGVGVTTIRFITGTSILPIIGMTGRTNVAVRNLSVRGNTFGSGIELLTSTGCTVENVSCTNAHDGILLDGGSGNLVTNATCSGNSADGIRITTNSSNNTITGGLMENNLANGIRIRRSTGNAVIAGPTGLVVRLNQGDGVLVRDSLGTSVRGLTISNNVGNGLFLRSTANSLIDGNTISGNQGIGVFLRRNADNDFDATLDGLQPALGNNTSTANLGGDLIAQ